ncbi:hypothetical protein O988_03501 [Pseudogymnoascus sp. VKM F-3808]|nr:hypothetical protein O988_03501 [Pseudogymnoascus sp. VKM F-3808]
MAGQQDAWASVEALIPRNSQRRRFRISEEFDQEHSASLSTVFSLPQISFVERSVSVSLSFSHMIRLFRVFREPSRTFADALGQAGEPPQFSKYFASDERKPQCRHCERTRLECQYDRIASSSTNGGFRFPSNHIWLDTPSKVSFVNSVDAGDEDDDNASPAALAIVPRVLADDCSSPYPAVDVVTTPPRDDMSQPVTPAPICERIHFASPCYTASNVSVDTVDAFESLVRRRMSGSAIYMKGPTKPLSDPMTARLLQHYIDNLASWFDLNDPQRQFERFVPHLALSCPIVLHAVLAFSACHLSRLDGSCGALYAVHHHELCIRDLIPALADPSTALDNVLPVSTVILWMYEMMNNDTDHQRHLQGCSSLFTHNRANIGFRELKRTAFWTYFREEISLALSNSKPTNIRPGTWKTDIIWGGDSDYVKTEKMTMLTAEVVDYCFGEGIKNGDCSTWDGLQHEIDSWKESLPESFTPLYVIDEIGLFPKISYLCTWHIVAMQFYHLTKVLLALHNPHYTSGIHFLHFARAVEDEILKHTIQLCGMTKALGSKHPGALVNAVQPLVICGRSLKEPKEQAELVKMLRCIEKDIKWTTSQGIQSLQEAWGSNITL